MTDLISRAALLKECAECQKTDPRFEERGWASHFLNDAGEASTEWYCVEDMIENAPAVDAVQVEHGRWQEVHTTARGYGKVWYQHCCTPLLYESPYYYCPHCGAKMDEKRRVNDG